MRILERHLPVDVAARVAPHKDVPLPRALEAVGVMTQARFADLVAERTGDIRLTAELATPAPDVEIVDFNERGPVLAVRPYTHTDHYWQVYFDTNRVIADTFGAAGYPVPESHVRMKQLA